MRRAGTSTVAPARGRRCRSPSTEAGRDAAAPYRLISRGSVDNFVKKGRFGAHITAQAVD
jgi:hypothetical protein